MPPRDPCRNCRFAGCCDQQGLVNMLALWKWLEDRGFECADYQPEYYKGIEGVFA